jgi:hypothetical protein
LKHEHERALADLRLAAQLLPIGNPSRDEALALIAETEMLVANGLTAPQKADPIPEKVENPAVSPARPGSDAPKVFNAGGVRIEVSARAFGAVEVAEISLVGDFKPGDENLFREALLTVEAPMRILISFDSLGGDLRAGMEIGRAIWGNQLMTVVEDGVCASACALAWLAGRPRFATAGAQIGFHAPTKADDPSRKPSSSHSAVVGGYLNGLGLTDPAIAYLTDRGPDEMEWLKFDRAKLLGIYVEEFN